MNYKLHKINIYFILFLLLQPVIDIITTVTMMWGNLPLSFGIIVRMLYLLAMVFYILYYAWHNRHARTGLYYLIGLFALVVVNFIISYTTKETYYIVDEVTFYAKVIYFYVLFFGFLIIFKELKRNNSDLRSILTNYFVMISIFIASVFFISALTGTAMQNYMWVKFGMKGWFNAGNEIGAVMAILLPVTALFALTKMDQWKRWYVWLPFVSLSISMLFLGTKVGYGGVLVTLVAALVMSLIFMFTERQHQTITYRNNAIISLALLVLLLVFTPKTPMYLNIFAHLDIIDTSEMEVYDRYKPEEEQEDGKLSAGQIEGLVFSSRDYYIELYEQQFERAPLKQKLFGMGHAGNYEPRTKEAPNTLKLIEMDFHDLFFAFGYIGFFYLIAPILYYSGLYVIRLLKRAKQNIDYFTVFTGLSFILGLGVAFIAGHVFVAPAVSIYVAFLLSLLVSESIDY